MGIEGCWEGTVFIKNLRTYIEDEKLRIDILSVDEKNNVKANIIELKLGLAEKEKCAEVTYYTEGSYDHKSCSLFLHTPDNSADCNKFEKRCVIIGHFDFIENKFKGIYFIETNTVYEAAIELNRIKYDMAKH